MGMTYNTSCQLLLEADNFVEIVVYPLLAQLCGNSWQQTQINIAIAVFVALAILLIVILLIFFSIKKKK